MDEPLNSQGLHRPSQAIESSLVSSSPGYLLQKTQNTQTSNYEHSFSGQLIRGGGESETILAAANNLVSEIKKAYSLVLQEKEEQILLLKEEVADLKTLVRVLENTQS